MQLRLDQINKSFNNKPVLSNITQTFEQGKIYGLLGRNGAGKTTLFNCISGELSPDSGHTQFVDDNGLQRPLAENDVGFVYSLPILPEFLTGYEFIRFFMDVNPNKKDMGLEIEDYFKRMSISEQDQHRLIKNYSHGMKNKLQMLLFMITRPPVILLDEPLTSFDVIVALEMKKLLREMKRDHILIFSTHILQLASDLCDEIVILHNGNLERVEPELLHEPDFEQQLIERLKDADHEDA